MSFPPEAFLIGAQKAGTTYLANLLAQHPDVCLAHPKEPDFFTQNRDKGLDWYRQRFAEPNATVLLDASTSYTACPLQAHDPPELIRSSRFSGVPQRIREVSPDARFVYLLRDPVARTYSAYWHEVRAGNEARPFREAIEADGYYLRVSDYRGQLTHYLEYFARESLLLLRFEDLVREPLAVARRTLEFLGVDAGPELRVSVGANRSFTYGPGIAGLNRALSPLGGIAGVVKRSRRVIPSAVFRAAGKMITRKIPEIREEDRRFIQSRLGNDIDLLTDH